MADEQQSSSSDVTYSVAKIERVAWSQTYLVAVGCLLAGIALGMFILWDDDKQYVAYMVMLILAFVFRGVRQHIMQHEIEALNALETTNKEGNRALTAAVKLSSNRRTTTTQTVNYAFTSNDFDDTAQQLLIGPIKKARKANAKVTGQGLVETFLKGLR